MGDLNIESNFLPHDEVFLRSLIWQDTRLDLIRDVLGHPSHMPSLPEFDCANKYVDSEEIRLQLSMLVEYDILERVTYDGEVQSPNDPITFYTLTESGWSVVRFFHETFSTNDYMKLSKGYNKMLEHVDTPKSVKSAAQAPRPSGGPK